MARKKLWFSYTPAERKKFRSAVAILKKKGIVSNIDARSARPDMIRDGKTLAEQVKTFDDVISDKAEAIKLPQSKLREYKKAGYETIQGRVIVPKLRGDKVTVKNGEIKIKEKSGIERVKKAVPYQNLEQWLGAMENNQLRINAMKRKNEWFAYKIKDNRSWRTYRTIGQLLDDLRNGSVSGLNLSEKFRHESVKNQNEFFEAFEIVRVPTAESWIHTRPERQRSPQSKRARKAWLKRTANTEKGEERRRQHAERQREYRANMKGKKLNDYKKKAIKRAKKSRKRRMG
jgi:hypothetical protein